MTIMLFNFIKTGHLWRFPFLLPFLFIHNNEAMAVPVVPNFTQGSMTSHTETTTKVTETINSIDYNTGWQYSVTGSNITNSGSSISPPAGVTNNTTNGVTSPWTSLKSDKKPDWSIVNTGQAFQFTESYSGPGMSNQTIITRTTEIQSVTDTVSIFSQ